MAETQPKLVLYGHADTPFTEKCRRGLAFKGLDYEFHVSSGQEDVRRWSPVTGLLPVLKVDDELVSDSTNILLRLDAIRPEPALLSPDPFIAAQQKSLEDWADESFLWYWQEWFRLERELAAPRAGTWSRLRRRFGGQPDEERRRAQTEVGRGLADRLDDLVKFLGSNPFFYADRPSLADLTVYAMLATVQDGSIPGAAQRLAERPTLVAYLQRVAELTGG